MVPYLNLLKQRNRALRFGHWIRSLQRSTQFPKNTLHSLPERVEMLYYYYFLSPDISRIFVNRDKIPRRE
jgi:hypothetical protein